MVTTFTVSRIHAWGRGQRGGGLIIVWSCFLVSQCNPRILLFARRRCGDCSKCAKCREGVMSKQYGKGGDEGRWVRSRVGPKTTVCKTRNPQVRLHTWPEPPKAPERHANVASMGFSGRNERT
jgi:hypothetical protein